MTKTIQNETNELSIQALYATRKKLSCTQWYCYAAEHMLPSAYMLSHPGMGATVQTFCRQGPKGMEKDASYMQVLNMSETEPWKVGQVRTVSPVVWDDMAPVSQKSLSIPKQQVVEIREILLSSPLHLRFSSREVARAAGSINGVCLC